MVKHLCLGQTHIQCSDRQHGIVRVYKPYCVQLNKDCEDVVFKSGSCGNYHTVLISAEPDNHLYGFGKNTHNQTGNMETEEDQSTPYLTKYTDIEIDYHIKLCE